MAYLLMNRFLATEKRYDSYDETASLIKMKPTSENEWRCAMY
jgi:hypothetical protein